AILLAPVTTLTGPIDIVVQAGETAVESLPEDLLDVFEEVFLVVLNDEGVVPALIDDLLRDGLLAAHRVDGDQSAVEFQQLQKRGNGRDLVGFRIDGNLPQGQVLGRGPGTHQMERAQLRRPGAAQRLAVDGDVFNPQ